MPPREAANALGLRLLLRAVNDKLAEGDERKRFDVLCECAAPTCTSRMTLPLAEYWLREDPTIFFVAPDHVLDARERVIERHEGWVVVEADDGPNLAA